MPFRNRLKLLIISVIFIATIAPTNGKQTEQFFLSGTDNENTENWEFFFSSACNSGFWSTIEVPSHWEQQDFGTNNYGRDYVTYGRLHRFADETGFYKRTFTVPENFKGNISFLDGIPSFGSKLALGITLNASVYGPQGETNKMSGS